MQVDLVSATTKDGVKVHGIFLEPKGPARGDLGVDAILMVHGSAGNFYASPSNRRAEMLRDMGHCGGAVQHPGPRYSGWALGGKNVGNAYEILDDTSLDMQATVGFLAEKGYKRVGIWGSSLGAVKVVYAQAQNQDPNVAAVISLSPLRLSHEYFLASELGADHKRFYDQAKALVDAGKPDELIKVTFPIDHYFTAGVYLDRHGTERYNLAAAHSDKVRCPLLVIGGTEEHHPRMKDAVRDIHAQARKGNPDAEMVIIQGGDHGLQNKDAELMETVIGWLQRIGSRVRV